MHKRMSPHGDADHMKEAVYIANNFKVDKVIFNCGEFNSLENEVVDVLKRRNISYSSCVNEVVVDFVKNPILIKNCYGYEIVSEKVLQKLLLEDIAFFIKELGSGFTYIGNEYKIKVW